MIYILVIFLSLLNNYIGIISQFSQYEVERLKNGSDIKKSISLFPTIPFTQITSVLIYCGLTELYNGLGIVVIVSFAIIVNSINIFRILKYS